MCNTHVSIYIYMYIDNVELLRYTIIYHEVLSCEVPWNLQTGLVTLPGFRFCNSLVAFKVPRVNPSPRCRFWKYIEIYWSYEKIWKYMEISNYSQKTPGIYWFSIYWNLLFLFQKIPIDRKTLGID